MRKSFTPFAMALAFALTPAACGDAPMHPEPAAVMTARAPSTGPGGATAASALAVTLVWCRDTGRGGYSYNTTACDAQVSGGTGGNTYTWDVIQTYRVDGPNSSYIEGVCSDPYLTVTFTVTDSSGATASGSSTFQCHVGGIDP